MKPLIKGLHHVTSMSSDAVTYDRFFRGALGQRRLKQTVNFDDPSVYHLYYGDEAGTPGTVMTYFPFPGMTRGRRGTGEVGVTNFNVPEGSIGFWKDRLDGLGVSGVQAGEWFGAKSLEFEAPDGDRFMLIEKAGDARAAFQSDEIGGDHAIRGFDGVTMRLADAGATGEVLSFMGYEEQDVYKGVTRYAISGGNGADFIDIEEAPNADPARGGAGSVHHVAFAVEDRPAQQEMRRALIDAGHNVTPVIDRDYFWSIYFRTPGGVLFEVATNEPGFDRDEDVTALGSSLKLPTQHEHLRAQLEGILEPLD